MATATLAKLPSHARTTLEAHIHSICYSQMRLTPRSTESLRASVLQCVHTLTIWAWQCDELFEGLDLQAEFNGGTTILHFTAPNQSVEEYMNSLEPPRTIDMHRDDYYTDD